MVCFYLHHLPTPEEAGEDVLHLGEAEEHRSWHLARCCSEEVPCAHRAEEASVHCYSELESVAHHAEGASAHCCSEPVLNAHSEVVAPGRCCSE